MCVYYIALCIDIDFHVMLSGCYKCEGCVCTYTYVCMVIVM